MGQKTTLYRVKAVTLRPSFGEIFVKIAKTPRPGLDLTTGAIQQRKCAERGSQSGRLHPVVTAFGSDNTITLGWLVVLMNDREQNITES